MRTPLIGWECPDCGAMYEQNRLLNCRTNRHLAGHAALALLPKVLERLRCCSVTCSAQHCTNCGGDSALLALDIRALLAQRRRSDATTT